MVSILEYVDPEPSPLSPAGITSSKARTGCSIAQAVVEVTYGKVLRELVYVNASGTHPHPIIFVRNCLPTTFSQCSAAGLRLGFTDALAVRYPGDQRPPGII